jgi:hypothetical protein
MPSERKKCLYFGTVQRVLTFLFLLVALAGQGQQAAGIG